MNKKGKNQHKKGDERAENFLPTPAMQLFAFQIARLGKDAKITEAADRVGISRQITYRWKERPGFEKWLEERVEYYRSPILEMLEQVAIQNLDDFRYWEAMALKYGFISDNNKPQTTVTNNVLVPAMTSEQAQELLKQHMEKK